MRLITLTKTSGEANSLVSWHLEAWKKLEFRRVFSRVEIPEFVLTDGRERDQVARQVVRVKKSFM